MDENFYIFKNPPERHIKATDILLIWPFIKKTESRPYNNIGIQLVGTNLHNISSDKCLHFRNVANEALDYFLQFKSIFTENL